jgi:hypothetical protein
MKLNTSMNITASLPLTQNSTNEQLSLQESSLVDDEFEDKPNIDQPLLSTPKENIPFGNIMTDYKQPNSIRIFYKNINGIRTYNTWDT